MNSKVVLISLYELNSLGIRGLHSFLESNGIATKTIFFKSANPDEKFVPPVKEELDALKELIKKIKPDLVGITLRTALLKVAISITEEIKKVSKAKTVWAGIHSTIDPESCINYTDFVIIGEGEEAFLELAQEKDIYNIKNLCFKKNNEIIKNEIRPLIEDLDKLPPPDHSDKNKFYINIKNDKIITEKNPQPPSEEMSYFIMTSRGCPFICTFCCNSYLQELYKGKGKYLRRRSVKHVINELKAAKKNFNLKMISFWDDIFTYDKEWLKEFSKEYKQHINIPFFCYSHSTMIDDEIVKLLKEANVDSVRIGIQSGSERVRKEVYKRFESNESILKAANIFKENNVKLYYDLIIENPFETEEDKRGSLNLLLSLPKPIKLSITSLTYFPHYPITEEALKKGYINEEYVEKAIDATFTGKIISLVSLDRKKEDIFWNVLYVLVTLNLSNKRILRLSNSKFLRNYPEPLAFFLSHSLSIYRKLFRKMKL